MVSIDTECTGLDFYHGTRPFFITTCKPGETPVYWEWPVNPLTREVQIPEGDVQDIGEYLFGSGPNGPIGDSNDEDGFGLVLQNCKFDFTALSSIGFWDQWDIDQAWASVRDTLMAGHLLASNQPHDLTTMAALYLGVDINPYEVALKEACDKARRECRKKDFIATYGTYAIAKAGRPDMPSAKETCWKADTWLPKVVAQTLGYSLDHPWYTVTRDYANIDSEVTAALWPVMRAKIKARGLWEIYLERLKVLPVAFDMERRGVTLNAKRLHKQVEDYTAQSSEAADTCLGIAAELGYDLQLPAGGVNNSLRTFMFEGLELPPIRNAKAKTNAPTLNAGAMKQYQDVLDPDSHAGRFVNALLAKRSRDTAVQYMNGYQRFWLPLMCGGDEWYVLHPNLNPTGTDTLRWSSNNPNEQNISKKEGFNLRYCFGPAPGREWWACDYENIELRIPAYESGEQAMIDLFEKPNDAPYFGSYHLMNASIIYPDLFWPLAEQKGAFKKQYGSTWYQWCKNFGFAVQYGAMLGSGTADRAAHKPGAHQMVAEGLKEMTSLNDHWLKFAERHGYVETMPDKTVNPKKGYPLICTRSDYGKVLPTVPLSYHVQSTAMWCTAKAMVRCQGQLNDWYNEDGFDGRIVLQVHDEMDFDFPKGGKRNKWRIDRLRELMELSGEDIGVPLKVAISYHPNNWSEEGDIDAYEEHKGQEVRKAARRVVVRPKQGLR